VTVNGKSGRSLRQQLNERLLAVFLLVALLGGIAILVGYQALSLNAQKESADVAAAYVQKGFARQNDEWERNTFEVKTQINFMRVFGAGSPDSWERLRAYFATLEGWVGRFPQGLVLRKDGSVGLAFGGDTKALAARLVAGAVAPPWFVSAERGILFVIKATPLWQGIDGNGRLLLLQPVDASVLGAITPPGQHLYLVQHNFAISGNGGTGDIGKSVDTSIAGRVVVAGRTMEQRVLRPFGDHPDAPVLVLQQEAYSPFPVSLLLAGSMVLLGLLTLALWSVMGRWARGVTDRIAELSRATGLFAAEHAMGPPVRDALRKALAQPDEIGKVAEAGRDLMESVLRHDEEHFAYLQTLDILEEGVVEIAADGRYLRASSGWARLAGTGRSHQGILFESFHPDDVGDFKQQFDALFTAEKTSLKGRIRLRRSDAKDLWVEYRFVVSDVGAPVIRSVRGVLRDITQSYLLEKHVTHMALHDALTGLPNRVLLEDRCKIALNSADRNGHRVALGFMDLDHFKHVNDQYGHKVGDEMLLYLSNALRSCLRAGDTLSRWGGDEFVVLLTDLTGADGAREAIAKLVSTCNQPIVIGNNVFNITFSMGVAVYPDDGTTVDGLLSQADRAMFSAKEQGRNYIRYFADIGNVDEDRKAVYIQHRLAAAIKDHKIQAWFQPIVDSKTHHVVGCEALARWHDESYGWVSPATFIPMAESLGLIRELGQQVWSQSMQSLQRWREMVLDLRIAVNVSRRQLFTPTFTSDLLADLERYSIPASAVDLEITESVATEEVQFTLRRLQELREAGFGVSIDDFGTGYSSLSQLHEMPATKVKIDISFVQRAQSEQGAQLIQAIVSIAAAFRLNTVAEGVESADIADTLRGFGVHMLQGYHFGKPMPPAEFEHFLTQHFRP
jgi:diguanylate cyclase (GGDEF)-like protein